MSGEVWALERNLAFNSDVGVELELAFEFELIEEEEEGAEEDLEEVYVPSLIPGPAEFAETNPYRLPMISAWKYVVSSG